MGLADSSARHYTTKSRKMEDAIKAILEGKNVPVDHILNHDSKENKDLPVTKRNVTYICSTVLFDKEGRVLLVQEAKPSCYGQWYLPAGRLEPGETIADGAKREVKEEAGVECDLTTLLCVELDGMWMRFTFMGVVIGGSLKTTDEKDKESLQAKFFHQDELPDSIRATKVRSDSNTSTSQGGQCVLRSKDILKLIALGRAYVKEKSHKECLPVIYPHKYITYRFVIVDRSSTSSMQILASKKGDHLCIPTIQGNVRKTDPIPIIASVLNGAFSMSPSECPFQICGLLSMEHRGTGQEEDGVCITHLINLDLPQGQALPEVTAPREFAWHLVTCSHLRAKLVEGCQRKIVPIL